MIRIVVRTRSCRNLPGRKIYPTNESQADLILIKPKRKPNKSKQINNRISYFPHFNKSIPAKTKADIKI